MSQTTSIQTAKTEVLKTICASGLEAARPLLREIRGAYNLAEVADVAEKIHEARGKKEAETFVEILMSRFEESMLPPMDVKNIFYAHIEAEGSHDKFCEIISSPGILKKRLLMAFHSQGPTAALSVVYTNLETPAATILASKVGQLVDILKTENGINAAIFHLAAWENVKTRGQLAVKRGFSEDMFTSIREDNHYLQLIHDYFPELEYLGQSHVARKYFVYEDERSL